MAHANNERVLKFMLGQPDSRRVLTHNVGEERPVARHLLGLKRRIRVDNMNARRTMLSNAT